MLNRFGFIIKIAKRGINKYKEQKLSHNFENQFFLNLKTNK